MPVIFRSIAVLIALCVTGQNMLWASQITATTPLKEVQQQARQDAAFLSTKGIVFTLLSIPVVYGIARLAYQQIQEKQALQLQNKSLEKEVARLREANITLNRKVMQAEKNHHSLERFIRFSNQVPVDITKDIAKYTDLANIHLSKEARESLFQQMLNEPWFKAFSERDKKFFSNITLHIMRTADLPHFYTAEQRMSLLWTWDPLFTETDLTLASKYLRGLCKQISAKQSILFAALLMLGMFTVYDAPAQAASQRTARRLNQNFNLFLNATEQELQTLEKDSLTADVCRKNAAMLHAMREFPAEVLRELQHSLPQTEPASRLRPVTAR